MKNTIVWVLATLLFMVSTTVLGDDSNSGRSFGERLDFSARLSAAQEPQGVQSEGVGHARIRFDKGLTKVFIDLRIWNLTGAFTRAHFHCNRPGANGPVAFGLVEPGPLMFDGRRVRGTLTNDDFNGADCEGVPLVGRPVNNIAALAFAMRHGLVCLNVHTDVFPGGEIRGQILPDSDDD